MSSTTPREVNFHDECENCGTDLPLDAPPYQRFCSVQCRHDAYVNRKAEILEARLAARRQARLDAKVDRKPCEECGATIPITKNVTARFCSELCGARHYQRRATANQREARLAERAKIRAERKGAAKVASAAAATVDNRACPRPNTPV